ncbi:MAG: GH25 family lysozyme [Actinomycetota bacterium]
MARSVGVAVAVLLSAVAVARFVWLPHYRPGLQAGERYGIDVSHHQGSINWTEVAGDGIAFAYIKSTEGRDFRDGEFRRNWDGAGRAGLARGAYHFFTLCAPGAMQAEHFLGTVPAGELELPPAIDLELAGNCSRRPDGATVRRELLAFIEAVEQATGQRVVLYVGDDFEDRYRLRRSLARPLWYPRFLRRPPAEEWVIWQVMGLAHVDGVEGDVDLDVIRLDLLGPQPG